MQKRTKIEIGVAVGVALVALGIIVNLTGKIRTEKRLRIEEIASHAKTMQALSKTAKALATAEAQSRELKTVVRNPDGTVALDGSGNPIFETVKESSSRSTSTSEAFAFASASSVSSTTSSTRDESEITEKPALKRWTIHAGIEPSGKQWVGAGFRQSLFIVEAEAYFFVPVNFDTGIIGLSVAF